MKFFPHFHRWDYFSNSYKVKTSGAIGPVSVISLNFRRCKSCRRLEMWKGTIRNGEYLLETREWLLNATKETGITLELKELYGLTDSL